MTQNNRKNFGSSSKEVRLLILDGILFLKFVAIKTTMCKVPKSASLIVLTAT